MGLKYTDLFEECDRFARLPNSFNSQWIHAKKFVDWQNLSNLSDKEVRDRVLKFLNQWSSHIKKTPEVIQGIKKAHLDSLDYLHALEHHNLWDLDYSQTVSVKGDHVPIKDAIYFVFNRFCEIGYHFREVAASKTLHQIHPKLFIMWDNPIMKAYGMKHNPTSYVNDFIPLMKEKLNQVLDSYTFDKNVTRDEAVEHLNSYKKYKTMVKLLDEYNWINYTYFKRSRNK